MAKAAVPGRRTGSVGARAAAPHAAEAQPARAQGPASGASGDLALLLAIFALGIVSAWLAWRWLVQPYPLTRYVEQPLLDLGKIGG